MSLSTRERFRVGAIASFLEHCHTRQGIQSVIACTIAMEKLVFPQFSVEPKEVARSVRQLLKDDRVPGVFLDSGGYAWGAGSARAHSEWLAKKEQKKWKRSSSSR